MYTILSLTYEGCKMLLTVSIKLLEWCFIAMFIVLNLYDGIIYRVLVLRAY